MTVRSEVLWHGPKVGPPQPGSGALEAQMFLLHCQSSLEPLHALVMFAQACAQKQLSEMRQLPGSKVLQWHKVLEVSLLEFS